MQKTKTFRAALIAVAACFSMSAHAVADPARKFTIPPGDLATALDTLARQSGVELMYSSAQVRGLHTAGVQGRYTAESAANKLLAGTKLKLKIHESGALLISGNNTHAGSASGSTAASPDGVGTGTGGPEKSSFWSRLRLTQSDSPSTSRVDAQNPSPSKGEGQGEDERRAQSPKVIAMEEIVVTGTHISGVKPPGQQLITLTAGDIERSGHTSAADVVRSLPQVFTGSVRNDQFATTGTTDRAANTNTSASNGIDLRGMGVGATLVLLNGRRLAPGGLVGGFADVSAIPLSAIERVEVLPDGASALYGADAVGGVVNFILRRRFDEAETRMNVGSVTAGSQREVQFSQSLGSNWGRGSALLSLEYDDQDNLAARTRERTNADLRPFGGSDFRLTQCNPGTLVVGTTEYVIPSGQNGADLTPAQLTRGRNVCNQNEDLDLFPEERRWNAFAHAEHDVTPGARIFLDAFYSRRNTTRLTRNVANLRVPNTNAFYVHPTGGTAAVTVRYDLSDELGPTRTNFDNDSLSVTAGFELKLGQKWSLTASTGPSRVEEKQRNNQGVDATALAAALADPNPATAFNPFGDGRNTSEATLARLTDSHLTQFHTTSRLWETNVVANGALFQLPGGPVRLALGANYHSDRLETLNRQEGLVSQVVEINTPSSLDREVYAGFGELFVPIVGTANRVGFVEQLDLSLAARYERFSDFGDTLVPRFGLTWSPFTDFLVRGTYSRSFKAPLLPDLSEASNSNLIVTEPVSRSAVLFASGGNRNLEPETASSWSAGIQYAPAASGLATSATYFSTRFTDRLGAINTLAINEASEPVITRNPTPEQRQLICSSGSFTGNFSTAPGDCLSAPIAMIFDARTRNLAELKESGIDLLANYRRMLADSRLSFGLNATYLFDYSRKVTASAPLLDVIDTPGNPLSLKVRGSLGWEYARFGANVFLNFQDDYEDTVSVPTRSISSWTTVDLNLSYAFDEGSWQALQGTRISLSALNLLDREPPFFNNPAAVGYDPFNANLLGRFLSVDLRKSW